jgi:class 3 adenylate cyclase
MLKTMTSALSQHGEIIQDTISEHGGHVFATCGDGFAASLGRAGDAMSVGLWTAHERLVGGAVWP